MVKIQLGFINLGGNELIDITKEKYFIKDAIEAKKNAEKIEEFIRYSSYEKMDTELLNLFKNDKLVSDEKLKQLAKMKNLKENSHLIIYEEIIEKGFVAWIKRFFGKKNEVIVNTKKFDEKERELFWNYRYQSNKIENFIRLSWYIRDFIEGKDYNKFNDRILNKEDLRDEIKEINFNIDNTIDTLRQRRIQKHTLKNNFGIKEEVYSRYWTEIEEEAYDWDKNENAFKNTEIGNLRKESDLKKIGYSTKLGEKERERILIKHAIPQLGQEKVIRHLEWLIKLNIKKKAMANSVSIWKSDLRKIIE